MPQNELLRILKYKIEHETDSEDEYVAIMQVIKDFERYKEEETCEYCDVKKSAQNFAYHLCVGRKKNGQ